MTLLLVRRASLLSVAAIALVALFAGLARLGIPVSSAGARAASHGPLFVLGVFFPLIALERAVALGTRTGYVVPLLGLVAGIGMVANVPALRILSAIAAGTLLLLNAALWRKQPSAHLVLMLVGSVCLVVGSVAFALDVSVSEVVLSWMGFFVLTIVAERIELARFAAPPRLALHAILGLAFALAGLTLLDLFLGGRTTRAVGVLLALTGAWLLRYDLARRTLRQAGLPRFAASAALLAAGWLLCSGLLLCCYGLPAAGPVYDAILHGVFVGFVLSMVFGHAPIILPAVARTAVPFHPVFYAPLLALHCGLLARWSGDLAGVPLLRQAGGLANAVALAAFPIAVMWARRRSITHVSIDGLRAK